MKTLLTLVGIVAALLGCSSPKNSYYTLSAPEVPASTAMRHATRIIVGPVTVPALVDNPQLVVKNSNNQVTVYEYQRWAGSLKSDIERVVAADLARDLSTPNVWSYTQSLSTDFDYQVVMDVQNIDSKLGESVTIDVLWRVKPKTTKTPAVDSADHKAARASVSTRKQKQEVTGRSVVHERVHGEGFESLVAAQSRAFDKVSREIATAISP